MIRQEQCDKVCRILDNCLANRPTERDSLIVAVRKAFDALEQPERKMGKWVFDNGLKQFFCDQCGEPSLTYDDIYIYSMDFPNFCPNCGAKMEDGEKE